MSSQASQANSKAEAIKDLNREIGLHSNTGNQIDMMKYLENYKKSVDYYNSYGLNSAPNSTRPSRASTQRLDTDGSFWNLN